MQESNIRSIKAGVFKAHCLQLMDEVQEKHINILITKHGKPVAKLVPLDETPIDLFGCLKGTITIKADLIAPIDAQWEAND
jgi:prevent-host-death family protein